MESIYSSFLQTFSLTRMDVPMIFVGLVLFYILYKALSKTVFLPMLEHIESREQATAGGKETANLIRQKAHAIREQYDQKLFQARVEANQKRLRIVDIAKKEASKIVEQAENDAALSLKAGREQLAAQMLESQAKIESEARALADLLANKVDAELVVH